MKKAVITFIMLLFTLTVSAQSDFDIAQEFMSKKGVTLKDNPRTRGADKPYSIFNGKDGKGFAIVVNGFVVGYDTENTTNEQDIPCCLKEMIETYSNIIPKAKTRAGVFEDPEWWTPRNVTPIEPLIKTKWYQSSPFNDLIHKTGICSVVALAQILHYFKVPQTYEEVTVGDTFFPITEFNHDLMLDTYEIGKYTKEQGEEVAKLYYYIYNIFNDIENINNAHDALWYRFGMKKYHNLGGRTEDGANFEHMENFWGNYYKQHDELLEQGIPTWDCGGNHAYVVDGRDSEGRYHINMGWGGNWDGYYATPDKFDEETKYNGTYAHLLAAYGCGYPYWFTPISFEWSYTSSIENITNNKSHNSYVYNLQGIKMGNSLEGLPKGIYIQNGKKIIKN